MHRAELKERRRREETDKSYKIRGYIWAGSECAWEQSKYAKRII